MIYFIDDFLPEYILKETIKDLSSQDYEEIKYPTKSFWVQPASQAFTNHVCNTVGNIENKKIEPILAFFRTSNNEIDTDWRIHADSIINEKRPDRALVIYISPKKRTELHGTAIWEHKSYGKALPKNVTNEEYDRMLLEEANDLKMWELNSVIGYNQNRAISWSADYFHSKYPNKSWKEGRNIFVMFYKTI